MQKKAPSTVLYRRKELILFFCALAIGALAVWASMSGWLREESWGAPIAPKQAARDEGVPKLVFPNFAALWTAGGRNPFGGAAVVLETGGKAKLPLPVAPALEPVMPPAPMVRPLDVLAEGGQ